MSLKLNDCQLQAEKTFVSFLMDDSQPELVIEGYAGTGKTTLVKHLINSLSKYQKSAKLLGSRIPEFKEISITATTNKAARVLADTMDVEPRTIYSHLSLILRNCFKTGEQVLELARNATIRENELIFVDEASFADQALLDNIRNQTRNCKIVYMGDPCQLINVKCDTSPIFQGGIPKAQLKTIMRHNGAISDIAALYRTTVETGEFNPYQTDGVQVRHVSGEDFKALIDAEFQSQDFKPEKSCKVVAWTNEAVNVYNNYIGKLRGFTSPLSPGETFITNKPIIQGTKEEIAYSTDEKVRIRQSRPETFNGVEGYAVELQCGHQMFVPTERYKVKALLRQLAKAKDWFGYFDIKNNWGDLRPVYSSTVHKSQGSTYDKVFVDLSDMGRCQNPDDMARLLYVAVSRASQEVVLSGELPPHYMGMKYELSQTA